MSLLYTKLSGIMKLPTGDKLSQFQEHIIIQHKELIKLFPEAMFKFYTTECAKGSKLEEEIANNKVHGSVAKYPNRSANTLGSYLYGVGDVSDENTYQRYLDMHIEELPSRALGFTPNGKRRLEHLSGSYDTLKLNKETGRGMYCIPLDVDKKDYDKIGYPLPEEFVEYIRRANVDSFEFTNWWFNNTRNLVPDTFEGINKYLYKDIVNNISWIAVTPGGFHAYIMLDPEERKDMFFADMSGVDYNMYMKGFHTIVGSDLMFDSSKVNISDVLRLPGTLHRKNKKDLGDNRNTFITVCFPVKSINYDELNEDGSKREYVLEPGDIYGVNANTIKYATKGRVKKLFTDIKARIENPKCMEQINWYRNESNTSKYKSHRGSKTLSISELEVRRCCYNGWLNWGTVIDNLPGGHIAFDKTYGSLKFRQPNGVIESTSGYKFKRMNLLSDKDTKNILAGEIFVNEEGIESNYCGGYVNDSFSNHKRPAGPMINFVYMYMQQFVCREGAQVSEIYEEVRKYFKNICPNINDKLLSNGTVITPGERLIGSPTCYIKNIGTSTYIKYNKQTSNGKEVDTGDGIMIFDRPVNIIARMMMVDEGVRFVSNNKNEDIAIYKSEGGVFVKEQIDYITKYLISIGHRTFAIPTFSMATHFENWLNKNAIGLHFLGSDADCRRFFSALDIASDDTIETHGEFGLETIWGNQGSKYGINNNTGNYYCVIGDQPICGDCPSILEGVDDTAKDIIDFNIPDVPIKEYREHIKGLGELKVYGKVFISARSCQYMNIAEEVMKANIGITLGPNLNVYGGSETGKSSLRLAIQSSLGYRPSKKYLSMQMTTPQPLIDSMLDASCMIYEEMTSKVESDQKKQEAKEIVIRGAANKETKMTGGLASKKLVKMRSCNIYLGESSIKDDSANNRIVKVKLTKGFRNKDKEKGEQELKWLQNHTVRGELYSSILERYKDKGHMFHQLVEYKKRIFEAVGNERVGDIECYGALLFIDILKLGTFEEFVEMIEYNAENDVSNIRDLSTQETDQIVGGLLQGIIYRAENEKSHISYSRFDSYPDTKYNNFGDNNYTFMIKIDLSTIKTNVSNFDNDVEKIGEVMKGFVQTIGNCIYIFSYGNEIVNHIKTLVSDGFLDLDIVLFEKINALVKDVSNLMCFGKSTRTFYSIEQADRSSDCKDIYWKALRKVIYTCGVML